STRRLLITWIPGAASREIRVASASMTRDSRWTRMVDPMKAATTATKATARMRVEVSICGTNAFRNRLHPTRLERKRAGARSYGGRAGQRALEHEAGAGGVRLESGAFGLRRW